MSHGEFESHDALQVTGKEEVEEGVAEKKWEDVEDIEEVQDTNG